MSGTTWLAFRWYDPTSPWTEILEHSAAMSVALYVFVGLIRDVTERLR